MKKITALILGIILCLPLQFTSIYADNVETPKPIKCHITVTDITDANDPFNVLADRMELTVPYVDLTEESDFIFNPNGLTVANSLAESNKITYLHAIYALHKMVYGNEDMDIISKLYVDGNGDITLFFGKIVATILYQNNDGVFSQPQCVELKDGDEVNICLYNYGHNQQIAIFDELAITVQRNEDVTLHLNQYNPDPEDSTPLADVYLTDSEGVYLLDENKHIATTDDNGEVTFNFAEGGLHRVSIMPEIGYYLDTGDDDEKETSKPRNLMKLRSVEVATKSETQTVTYDNSINGWYNLLDETADNYLDDSEIQTVFLNYLTAIGDEPDPSVPVLIYSWDDEEEETTEVPLTKNSRMVVKSTFTPEIVRYPVLTYDEPQPMVAYTMPFATINVDTTFALDAHLAVNKGGGYETICVDVINSDTIEYDDAMPCIRVGRYTKDGAFLGWVGDGDGTESSWGDMSYVIPKTIAEITGSIAFQFVAYPEDIDDDPDNDTVYKVFCWKEYDEDAFAMGEPIIPPIILTPSTQNTNNAG